MTGGTGPSGAPKRVRLNHVEWTANRLSGRDWEILASVNRLRLLRGGQLERLHFADLSGHSRSVVRGRVLRRLVTWRVLVPLERRVGGAARGSAGTIYALDATGRQLLLSRGEHRVRHAGVPGERMVRHTLAVAEQYTALVELARSSAVVVSAFEAEPGAWWPDGLRDYLKPDAHVVLKLGETRDHWWIEVDLGTEALPTVRRKLLVYLDFYRRGQLGPGGVMPRVLVTTTTPERRDAIAALVAGLPEPAKRLFMVALDSEAVASLQVSLSDY